MKLRIPEHLWQALRAQLLARKEVESAGLLFGEAIATAHDTVIAIREAFALPDYAYQIRRRDQLSIDAIALNRLIRPARNLGRSVLTIHTHPGAASAWFSAADDAGDARLMPSLRCQIPDVPHGSMVLVNDGGVIARVFDESNGASEIPATIVGRVLRGANPTEGTLEPWFNRQELALGRRGQRQLRQLRAAVIGLGGVGSIVCMQLAHLGVGELVLIDGDIVEASNLSRITGATQGDVGRTYKVDVAARYVRAVGLVRHVEAHREFLTAQHEALLAETDVIVSCVDQQTPRALLNRMAYRCLLPVVDLGVAFRVNAAGAVVGDAGRVVVFGPGRPCLACWGHLDADALRIEALSADQRESELSAGYIQGGVEEQPSVIAFNTMVAGAGVAEVLRLATAFAGSDTPPLRLAFSFAEGTVRRNVLPWNQRCTICGAPRSTEEELPMPHTGA
ncbi:MAG: ThiF family adenylyltransferase [Steroidobacteraceae bacterium]